METLPDELLLIIWTTFLAAEAEVVHHLDPLVARYAAVSRRHATLVARGAKSLRRALPVPPDPLCVVSDYEPDGVPAPPWAGCDGRRLAARLLAAARPGRDTRGVGLLIESRARFAPPRSLDGLRRELSSGSFDSTLRLDLRLPWEEEERRALHAEAAIAISGALDAVAWKSPLAIAELPIGNYNREAECAIRVVLPPAPNGGPYTGRDLVRAVFAWYHGSFSADEFLRLIDLHRDWPPFHRELLEGASIDVGSHVFGIAWSFLHSDWDTWDDQRGQAPRLAATIPRTHVLGFYHFLHSIVPADEPSCQRVGYPFLRVCAWEFP